MSATVSSMGDARRKKQTSSPRSPKASTYACLSCGATSFMVTVNAVARQRDGSPGDIVGYLLPLRCATCGEACGE